MSGTTLIFFLYAQGVDEQFTNVLSLVCHSARLSPELFYTHKIYIKYIYKTYITGKHPNSPMKTKTSLY